MSKNYTQKTATLRAMSVDSRIVDAKKIMVYPGAGDSSERKNILDLIQDNIGEIKMDIYDERGTNTTEYDIWGRSIETVDGNKMVRCKWLNAQIDDTNKQKIAQISHNKAIDSSDKLILNVECDRIKSAVGAFASPSLTSFSGNLNNLEDGSSMFEGAAIKTIDSDFHSLKNAEEMFAGTSLISFTHDMPKLHNATAMFKNTANLTTVGSSLDTLYDATEMFRNSSIESFSAFVPYLYKADNMFANSNVSAVTASFSNLLSGVGMFENTNLSKESVRIIAETLPKINGFTYAEDGSKEYAWTNGLSFNYQISQWSSEIEDTISTDKELSVSSDNIGEIMITWKDPSVFSKDERAIIIYEYFKLMQLKGWTVISNIYEEVYDEDGEIIVPTDVVVRKVAVDNAADATHSDSAGNYYHLYSGSTIYNAVYGIANNNWSTHSSITDAETSLGLTVIG